MRLTLIKSMLLLSVATPPNEDTMRHQQCHRRVREVCSVKYLIKSALTLCFWKRSNWQDYNITYSPEFSSSHAHAKPTDEFLNQTFAIYAVMTVDGRWTVQSKRCRIWRVRYLTLEQAFSKYLENTFLPTSHVFNEMYQIYNLQVFQDLMHVEAITLDKRIVKPTKA